MQPSLLVGSNQTERQGIKESVFICINGYQVAASCLDLKDLGPMMKAK